MLEDLSTGIATTITADLVLEATFSPDESRLAYTFATGEGFGLATVKMESKEKEVLISENVLPDFLQWDSSGTEVYFFETTNETSTVGIIPHKVSVTNKTPIMVAQDDLPSHFPKLSLESADLNASSRELSYSYSEIHYPFEVSSPDSTKRVCGGDFFGNTSIRLCDNANFSNQTYLAEGRLLKLTNGGIIVRSFEENRTATDFVSWEGNKTRLAVSTQVSYNLPLSSFTLTQGGASYPSPGNCNISSHTGSLSFAYDMQNQTIGKHILASAEGLVVNIFNTANCNSGDPIGCSDYSSTCSANGGWGNTVIIQHADTTYSRYAHLQFNSVQVLLNASACQGLYLGNQGHTGNTAGNLNGCGDHLHFQKQSSVMGASISASFSDAPSNPLSCGASYTSGSAEVSSCCSSGTATLRNRDNGPPIHPPGSVIKIVSNPTVYLIDPDNRKRPLSASALSQLYNQSTDARTSTNFNSWVIIVGQDELDLYELGGSIFAAQPGNGQPFPDGKLISFNGEVSIVTGVGRRRPFALETTFTGLGFKFCQVVNVSQTEYNSYPAGPWVDAMPMLTSSVSLSPPGPYVVGQSITGSFTLKNVGYQSVSFSSLGVGGRLNGTTVYDMNFVSTTLAAGSSYSYGSQPRQLTSSGTYDFFAVYQENNGHWAISVPAASGVIRSRQITVGTAPPAPTANPATNVTSSSFTANWSSSSGATGYRLDVSTSSSFGSFVSGYQNLDVGNVLNRSVTGLSTATTYFYRVRAYNGGGTSGNSNTISVTTTGVNVPDLIVTSLTAPTTGSIGGEITVSVTVANQGSANSGAFRLGFYFSTDSTITTGDTFTGWSCDFPSGLAAGASMTCGGPVGVPSSLSPGTYYFGAIADDLGAVAESNETNNARSADTGPIILSAPTQGTCASPYNLTAGQGFNGNTSGGQSSFGSYSCIGWNESGPERVHTITLGSAGTLTATLSNLGGIDLDVFILSSCSSSSCLAFGDNAAGTNLGTGTYYIVVDGFNGAIGGYTLTVNVSGSSHTATVGLYNPANAGFYLRNSNTTGGADTTFSFGPAGQGWIPLSGDWDGDGTDTIGLYNPANGTFYLRNSNSIGFADVTFTYGPPGQGWIPLAGDWNGDAVDTVGLYNPANGTFYLRNSNSTGVADITFGYGPVGQGWIPIVGDWDNNTTDTVGLYNPSNSAFYLRNSNSVGNADLVITFGPAGAGWTPIIGDWDGDGTDTIGLYNPSNGAFYLRNSNSFGGADVVLTYGPASAGWKPIVGDWDGL